MTIEMSKRIDKCLFLEGLTLCERNGLQFFKDATIKLENDELRIAYLLGIVSFEEMVKAHMILDSYDEDYISGNKWEDKMTQHKPKLLYGAKILRNELKEAKERVIKMGIPESHIITNVDSLYTEKTVERMLTNRILSIYVDYDPDEKTWIPTINEFDINEVKGIIFASASLWVILSNRKNEMNIKTIPSEEFQKYFM
ncbi:MAG: AbiV family abortive infection protein [Candidatus Bathyarchaeia archaeon]